MRTDGAPTASHEELLNVYDAAGDVVGARPARARPSGPGSRWARSTRSSATARGACCCRGARRTRRTAGAGTSRWAATSRAGEDFDATAVREAGEELFDDAGVAARRPRRARGSTSTHLVAAADLAAARGAAPRRPAAEPARRAASRPAARRAQRPVPRGDLRGPHRRPARRVPAAGLGDRRRSRYFTAGRGRPMLLRRRARARTWRSCGWPTASALLARPAPSADDALQSSGWSRRGTTCGAPSRRGRRRRSTPAVASRAAVALILRDGAARHRAAVHPPRRAPAGPVVGPDGVSRAAARSRATPTCAPPPSARPRRRSASTSRARPSPWARSTRCGPWRACGRWTSPSRPSSSGCATPAELRAERRGAQRALAAPGRAARRGPAVDHGLRARGRRRCGSPASGWTRS